MNSENSKISDPHRLLLNILEVYNRAIWHTPFTGNFQINNKAYLQTLKFLPMPPNIRTSPIHTKK